MRRNFTAVIMAMLIVTALVLTGCGSDGGNEAPVISTETFQLKTAYISALTASSKSFTVSGTVSGVSVYGSGTETESALTSATFEGFNCFKQVATVTGTISINGTSFPNTTTNISYYDANFNYLGSSGSEYTQTMGVMSLPLTAKVNDTGVAFTETIYPSSSKPYSTGTYTSSYSLEPDTAATAILKLITTEKDVSGTVVSTSVSIFRLTPSGEITSLSGTFVSSTSNLRMTY